MEPLFFGESGSALFGVYHPPLGTARDHGVLLCPPIAQEYVRAHWALRQLAVALSRAGLHVMRFDWFGVGDSAGDAAEGSVERWVGDVGAAAAELRDTAAIKRISLVGLRLGAPLAAAAVAGGLRARDLVLWDPVVRGGEYLGELMGLHEVVRADPLRYGFSLRRDLNLATPPPSRDGELVGFPFPPGLRSEIEALDTARLLASKRPERVTIVCSSDRPEYRRLEQAVGARVEVTGTAGAWDDADEIENAFLPGAAIAAIARELAR